MSREMTVLRRCPCCGDVYEVDYEMPMRWGDYPTRVCAKCNGEDPDGWEETMVEEEPSDEAE